MSTAAQTSPPQIRVPTKRQHDTLRILASGAALVTGTKSTVEPLLRHGWVSSDEGYSWVRITPDGLHALARAVERYGLPEMKGGHVQERVCANCDRPWNPRCRCGGRSYRLESREIMRPNAGES